uniref:Agmatinase 1 n=1 Tax=Magnetococcus massalia (strain MO-1) TaxID=451514 RepID=A0A1S7LLY6_MAGMO|nr:Agmatinase 1 [Candidatus Magnetococcus massalia]
MSDRPTPPLCGEPSVPLQDARVVVLPLPYEGTACYGKGTAQGPAAILHASPQMELYDEVLEQETLPEFPIHTLAPLVLEGLPPEEMVERVYQRAKEQLLAGRAILGLGGEHSVTEGVVKAYHAVYGDSFSVVQIDAHTDMRDSYEGSSHSHACVMRRIHEMGIPFVQLGIRSVSREEIRMIRWNGLGSRIFWAKDIHRWQKRGEGRWLDEMAAQLRQKVFITVDLDGFDPAYLPATGTPEPGGLDWFTVGDILDRIAAQCQIIGSDVTELAPIAGHHASDFLAARLSYRLLGYMAQTAGSTK